MAGRRGRPRHDDVLTPTEWQVVDAVRHGLSNRQIASRRGVSIDAIKFHVANALGKLGLRDRRALRVWSGVPRGSRLSSGSAGLKKGRTMSNDFRIAGLGQVSRSVTDIAQAESWYRDVLGLSHLYTFDKLAFFDCGGTRLMLSQGEALQAAESILYLRVDDVRDAHAVLEGRGVEFVSAPHMIHRHANGAEEWMAFFNDPEGRPLAIMSVTPAD